MKNTELRHPESQSTGTGLDESGNGQRGMMSRLRSGLAEYSPRALQSLMEGYWRLVTDVQALAEDVRGVDGRQDYLSSLKGRILERLYSLDELLSGSNHTQPIHHLALTLESGLAGLSGTSGSELIDVFYGSGSKRMLEVEVENITAFLHDLLEGTPGKIEEAGGNTGAAYVLRILQRWTALCTATNLNSQFLTDLLKEL